MLVRSRAKSLCVGWVNRAVERARRHTSHPSPSGWSQLRESPPEVPDDGFDICKSQTVEMLLGPDEHYCGSVQRLHSIILIDTSDLESLPSAIDKAGLHRYLLRPLSFPSLARPP